jgi:ankyrin repeat protein
MPTRDLPARPNLEQYKKQAKDLLKGWKSADPKTKQKLADAQHAIAREHGFDTWKMFTERIAHLTGAAEKAAIWKSAEDAVVAGDAKTLERLLREHEKMLRHERPQSSWLGGLTPDYSKGDARAIIAREHYFESWDQFAAFQKHLHEASSPVARFERTVDAIVAGDAGTLADLLRQHPDLIRARSVRKHHSTLLHYVGANGIESWRQRTPKNAVAIARMLLDAGAEIDAEADMYGPGCTTLGLTATSIHPKNAGVLRPLIDLLLERGARIEAPGAGNTYALVNGCLANGRAEAAEHLAAKGAPLNLEGAAGVGRLDLVRSFFNANGTLTPMATVAQMHDGFNWACEYGRTDVVEYLLDHGVDVNALTGRHKQIGLHWAAYGAHLDIVKALLKRAPKLDARDAAFGATPLGWAMHGWWERRDQAPAAGETYYEIVALLVAAGAPVEKEWLSQENASADPRMAAALRGKPSA